MKHALVLASAGVALSITSSALAQLRIVSVNASNATDLGDVATPRNPWMTTILTAINTTVSDDPIMGGNTGIIKPIDILCLQETTGPSSTSLPYANLMDTLYPGANYTHSTVGGASTGGGSQGLIYNANALTLVGTVAIGTASTTGQPRQALRYQLRPIGYSSAADIYIYNSHYKAGDTTDDEDRRLVEAQAIRANADALGPNANIIYLGDFNFYRNTDPAYQFLTASGNGKAFDPINQVGNWNNNSGFKAVHTQSPFNSATATAEGSGFSGTGGGMDDRFDQQLISTTVNDGDGFAYIANSYQAFGNNNTHTYNLPINSGANTGTVQNALASVLDHLPIVADYQLPSKLNATAGTAPAKIIKGATASVTVSVNNAAPVAFVNGADQLSYSLVASGALSGSTSGVDNAMGATNSHTVSLSSATAGAKSGSISVTATSQQDGGTPLNTSVNYDVLEHANASLDSPSDTNAQTIDFGYIPQNFTNRTSNFAVHNLNTAPGFTARLDIDGVLNSGDTARLTTNAAATGANPITAGTSTGYTATADTSTVGAFTATHTLTNSDENLPGATAGTSLVVTTTSRVIAVGDFPVTGFINLLAGEDFSTGPATIGASATLTKSGPGTLQFSGAQSHGAASALNVTAGSVILHTDAGSPADAPLAITLANPGLTTTFNATQHLRGLTLAASTSAVLTANGNRTLYTDALSVASTAALDLADNDLVVNNGAFSDVQSLVLAGFGNTTGITSSTSDGSQILALFDNALVGASDWQGTTISANAIVGKYTYFGDVNIDGQVSGDDYTVIDANLDTDPGAGIEWISGDANLDGLVTGDDYTVIDANLGSGSGNPLAASQINAVPEPSVCALAGASLALVLPRRRRRD